MTPRPSPDGRSPEGCGHAQIWTAAVVGLGFFVLLAPGTSSVMGQTGAATDDFGRQLAEARLAAIADGDLPRAIRLFEGMMNGATSDLRAIIAVELGEALETSGRETDAIAAFRQALQADPTSSQAAAQLARLGALAQALGPTISEATSQPEDTGILVSVPKGPRSWEALLPLEERSRFRQQVDQFSRERAARALYNAAKRIWAEDRSRAAATLELVVSQFPGELRSQDLIEIGNMAMQGQRPQLAVKSFKEALRRPPSKGRQTRQGADQLKLHLGEALMQLGVMSEANSIFQEIMALGSAARTTNGRALAIPAEIHFRETRSLKTWQEVQAVSGLFRQGQEAQYYRHQPGEAAKFFWRIVADYPDSNYDGRALVQLAAIAWFEYQDAKGAQEAIDLILQGDRRFDLWPDGMRAGAWGMFYSGRIKEALGDRAGARASYLKLLEDFPGSSDHEGKSFAVRATQRLSLLGGPP